MSGLSFQVAFSTIASGPQQIIPLFSGAELVRLLQMPVKIFRLQVRATLLH